MNNIAENYCEKVMKSSDIYNALKKKEKKNRKIKNKYSSRFLGMQTIKSNYEEEKTVYI